MYQIITKSDFRDAFKQYNQSDNFSYEGLGVLFDYLTEEDGDGPGVELDVIAICCDFTEYENLKEFQEQHSADYETMEDVEKSTLVLKIDDDSFIVQNF